MEDSRPAEVFDREPAQAILPQVPRSHGRCGGGRRYRTLFLHRRKGHRPPGKGQGTQQPQGEKPLSSVGYVLLRTDPPEAIGEIVSRCEQARTYSGAIDTRPSVEN